MVDIDSDNSRRKHRRPWWDKAFNLFLFWTVFAVSNFIFSIVVPFYSFCGGIYLTRWAASSIGLTRVQYSVIPAVVGAVAAVGCFLLSIWFHVSIRRRWPQFDPATAHKAAYIGHRWEDAHDDDDDE